MTKSRTSIDTYIDYSDIDWLRKALRDHKRSKLDMCLYLTDNNDMRQKSYNKFYDFYRTNSIKIR